MIFPILNGLLYFSKAPITWCLVLINTLIMVFSSVMDLNSGFQLTEAVKDKMFVEIQGAIYQSYLQDNTNHQIHRDLASLVEQDDSTTHQILGVLAFRDEKFLETASGDFTFTDEVALNYWQKRSLEFMSQQRNSLSYLLGVNSSNHSLSSWWVYMFAHGSWMHLFSNMLFLLLVGATLELCVGSLGLLIIYLFSGFIACGFFILMSGLSGAPLIGASGAVSGLISMLAVLSWNRPVRFVYWLVIPRKDALGFIYLPGYVLLMTWLVADFSGFLSSSNIFGGVAHSAHLGGHLAGIAAGGGLLLLNHFRKTRSLSSEYGVEMFKPYPLTAKSSANPLFLPR